MSPSKKPYYGGRAVFGRSRLFVLLGNLAKTVLRRTLVVMCYGQSQLSRCGSLKLQVKLVESVVVNEWLMGAFHLVTPGGR